MSNLNIKNIPTEIHQSLKKQAEKNHRSLNQEILTILEQATKGPAYRSEETLLARIHETAKHFKGTMTLEEMDQAKREGRP